MTSHQSHFPNVDEAYRYTVGRILSEGSVRTDRTGVGTISVFDHTTGVDMSDGSVPIVSLKKTGWRDAYAELIWMLSGSDSLVPLLEQGIHIWTDWPMQAYVKASGENITRDEFEARVLGDAAFARHWGTIYPCYGTEMRRYQSANGAVIDQMGLLIETIKNDPFSRRLHWSLWRPEYINIKGGTGLPPCHNRGTFNITEDKNAGVLRANLKIQLRSSDIGLGWSYNQNYAYLLRLVCAIAGLEPGRLIVNLDDAHIYLSHVDALRQVLDRPSRPDPKFIWKRKPASIDDNLSLDDFEIVGYEPQPFIRLPVAV